MDIQAFNLYEGGEHVKPQNKRFVDKDGFAFPAPVGHHKDKSAISGNKNPHQDGKFHVGEGPNFLCEDNSHNVDTESSYQPTTETDDIDSHTKPCDKGAALQEVNDTENIKDLMTVMNSFQTRKPNGLAANEENMLNAKCFIQEMSDLQTEWSKIFSQSEEFELGCVQKIDVYTEKAKSLNRDLERQKNALCHRIRGIGGILQTFE